MQQHTNNKTTTIGRCLALYLFVHSNYLYPSNQIADGFSVIYVSAAYLPHNCASLWVSRPNKYSEWLRRRRRSDRRRNQFAFEFDFESKLVSYLQVFICGWLSQSVPCFMCRRTGNLFVYTILWSRCPPVCKTCVMVCVWKHGNVIVRDCVRRCSLTSLVWNALGIPNTPFINLYYSKNVKHILHR